MNNVQLLDIESIQDIYDLEIVETTIGTNGYPSRVRPALTCDSISTLQKVLDENENLESVWLHKRDGWSLWERSNGGYLDPETFMKESEIEYSIKLVCDENTTIEDVFVAIFGYDWYEYQSTKDIIGSISNWENGEWGDLIREGFVGQVFYNPFNDYAIDYAVQVDQNGYCYDTHHYKYGIIESENL